MDKLRVLIALMIPWFAAAVAFIAAALKLFDPVIAALVLTALVSFGEAIAYSVLALGASKHASAYGFVAGVEWLAAVVFLILCVVFFGWWTPPPSVDAIILNRSCPMGQQMERLQNIGRLMNIGRPNPQHPKSPSPMRTDQ